MRHVLICLGLTATWGCSTSEVDSGETDLHTDTDTEVDLTCDPVAAASACGDETSVIRGFVTVADGFTPSATTGTLVIGLTHEWLGGGATGGFYHRHTTVPNADLSAPVPFEFDMCAGGEMWSEENCSFQLSAHLDINGNAGSTNVVPDPGEPSGRVQGFEVSCHAAEAPCQVIELDCDAGASCVAFTDPGQCVCYDETCNSDIVTCQ